MVLEPLKNSNPNRKTLTLIPPPTHCLQPLSITPPPSCHLDRAQDDSRPHPGVPKPDNNHARRASSLFCRHHVIFAFSRLRHSHVISITSFPVPPFPDPAATSSSPAATTSLSSSRHLCYVIVICCHVIPVVATSSMLPPNDDLIFDSWFLDGVLVKVLNFLGGVVGASIHFLRRVLFPSSSVL